MSAPRSSLAVAPPLRRAINRKSTLLAPHLLSVAVASDESVIANSENFAQRILPLCDNEERKLKKPRTEESPKLFSVPVFVWQDSTIREIFEAVLVKEPAALDLLASSGAHVRVSHAYPARDRKPCLSTVGNLSANGPIDAKIDMITVAEMMTNMSFRAGDLLVFSAMKR